MQSAWWQGDWPVTQNWGCTGFAEEGYNPNHPECPYFHEGIDLGLPYGTLVFSGIAGRCLGVGFNGYGADAVALTDGTFDFYLGHGYQALVGPGDPVGPGTPVMLSDSEGFSTGDHLHFEVRPRGGAYRSSLDPTPWLVGKGPLPDPVAPQLWPWPLEDLDMSAASDLYLALTLVDPGYHHGPTPGDEGGPGHPGPADSWRWRWCRWYLAAHPDAKLPDAELPAPWPGSQGYAGPAPLEANAWEWRYLSEYTPLK